MIPYACEIEQAAALLRQSSYAVALTGAGISTPSGIPDFRSPHSGLWEKANPLEVASLYGFRRNPEAFYHWVRPLVNTFRCAEPNAAHNALARLEQDGILKALITQNIDMLHTRAGSREVFELHGHLREATCGECYRVVPADGLIDRLLETGEVPRCEACGGVLKPNVILFGEQLPVRVLHAAQRAARRCDVILVVGSSLTMAPASDLPLVALAHGAKLIVVNYEATYIDAEASVVIRADVAEILPRLLQAVEVG